VRLSLLPGGAPGAGDWASAHPSPHPTGSHPFHPTWGPICFSKPIGVDRAIFPRVFWKDSKSMLLSEPPSLQLPHLGFVPLSPLYQEISLLVPCAGAVVQLSQGSRLSCVHSGGCPHPELLRFWRTPFYTSGAACVRTWLRPLALACWASWMAAGTDWVIHCPPATEQVFRAE